METQDLVVLQGFIFDIEGNALKTEVSIGLNKKVTKYKTTLSVSGEEQIVESSDVDGSWSISLTETTNMTADTYYRITINQTVFRKRLESAPALQNLNDLVDYS